MQDIKSLPYQANLSLKYKMLGGQNCDLCFGDTTFVCNDCNQHFCNECSCIYHRHPKRLSHVPIPIASGGHDTVNNESFSISQASENSDMFSPDISMQDAL